MLESGSLDASYLVTGFTVGYLASFPAGMHLLFVCSAQPERWFVSGKKPHQSFTKKSHEKGRIYLPETVCQSESTEASTICVSTYAGLLFIEALYIGSVL